MSDYVVDKNGINTLLYLDEVSSTNAWCKQNLQLFDPVGAVYAACQTAGRGRLGRSWAGAAGQGLYYTVVLKTPLAQPAALPLYASLAVARALRAQYGIDCQIKWPNDLLLGGKKIVGILCEGLPDAEAILCGIGINLTQPQSYFDAAALPHATSLALAGVAVQPGDAARLARALTDFGFDHDMYDFERRGFSAICEEYKAHCINLNRPVQFAGGCGIAQDIDAAGRLVVATDAGNQKVFTGEVSVRGIYGSL